MTSIDMSDNITAADKNAETPFDYNAAADLFPSKSSKLRRPIFRYQRFVRASDAIRYAIEVLPAEHLMGTYLEVDEARFDSSAIRRLYDSTKYPLVRRTAA